MSTTASRKKVATVVSIALMCVTIAMIIVVLFLIFTSGDVKQVSADPVDSTSSIPVSSEPPPSSEPIPPPATVKLIGVGDNLIHEGLYQQAKRLAAKQNKDGYDFSFAYNEVADLIASYDIASLNQETMQASIYQPSSYPLFNSPTALGDHMLDIGFDVFNQATNHSLDKGENGAISTLDYWHSKANATVVGFYKNQADCDNIRTLKKNDITFSFIGMTESTNGLALPEKSELVLMKTGDEASIKSQIEKAKSISDVVVVNVHWGVEYTHSPNSYQKTLAKKMVDWGADIILGHHPHVIQPVEYITRADGTKAVVCYSLGNFISMQDKAARMIGGMLAVTVEKNFETKQTSITDVTFLPVITHYDSGMANARNYPLTKYTKELAACHGVRKYSPEFDFNYIQNTVNSVIDKQFLK